MDEHVCGVQLLQLESTLQEARGRPFAQGTQST
jgi:hypothetical protein